VTTAPRTCASLLAELGALGPTVEAALALDDAGSRSLAKVLAAHVAKISGELAAFEVKT
jgi:hypothetical protein